MSTKVVSPQCHCTVYSIRLLKEQRDLNAGCTINGLVSGAMCQADGPAVACLYEACMQRTLDIIFAHSCCWRYNHNPFNCMCAIYDHELKPYNTCNVYIGGAPIAKVCIGVAYVLCIYCKKIEKVQESALCYVLNDCNNTYSNIF